MDPAAALDDVVVVAGGHRALDGLTLALEAGRVTALLGPNGAGKTTTIAVLAGLTRPESGSALVLGGTPGRLAAREQVGVMLQEGGLPSGARAGEIVRHVAALRGQPGTAPPLLDRLGLEALGRTPIRRMSGGERARVSLACALVGSPRLVLLDEPTAGLDPRGRAIVADLVAELRDHGTTVLLSTHVLDEAERLCDDVAIIVRGRCAASGSLAAMSAGGSESVSFEASLHLDLSTLCDALPEGCRAVETEPGRYRVEGPADPRTLATVTAWCAQHGVMPRGLRTGTGGLEDLYWRLAGSAGPEAGT
ncbi:MAG: ABC transporter ATP-binding protein [bacterium]